jgi:NTE family protein
MKKGDIRLLLIMAIMFMTQGMRAQEMPSDSDSCATGRKKVAVVLSGGGAKGMAHIGALKVIERAGIPIDIITGTSMGSIIGGLYAIGYNAQVLDSVVRVQDWSYVITDKENLSKQSLADRKKQNTYVFSRGLTIGKHNQNDGGIIKGKNLMELFQNLCVDFTDSLDFSKDLPIPYACVATDIVDNTEYDFHSGYLPLAMRASMAIPAAFSPVRIGNRVLVDGGLRNNYPADIAREMGADIIIGVTVQGPEKTADELVHTTSILSQIIDVNCKNKYEDNLAITDVPIRVNTTGYGPASFTPAAIDTLIRRGEEEAMRHWDEIIALKERIGIDDDFKPVIPTPVNPKVMQEKQRVVGYVFENMTPQDEQFLRRKFHLAKGDSIDSDRAQQLTTSMRMDLFYQTAECRLIPERIRMGAPNEDQGEGVRVILVAGNRKTSQVYAGFRFDNEEHASIQLGADFPIESKLPMIADVTLRLGKRMMMRGELNFHPSSFTSPSISYTFRRNDLDIFSNGDRDYSIIYHHHQVELLPINLRVRHFDLQVGGRWDYIHYRDKLESSSSKEITLKSEHYFSYHAMATYNAEDNWYFPTRGARFKAEYAYLTDNFAQLDHKAGMSDVNINWRMSFTQGSRFTLQPMAYARLLFGPTVPHFFENVIGGDWFGHYVEQQMPFAGIGNIEYVGHHFIALQLQAQQRIGSSQYVLFKVATAQHADRLRELPDHKTMLGCQAAYYYNTLVGPVGAALGYSTRTRNPYLFLNIGFEF